MIIPEKIKKYIDGKPYKINKTGCSGSVLLVFEEYTLKISKDIEDSLREIEAQKFLAPYFKVPNLVDYEIVGNTIYLLRELVKGKMINEPNQNVAPRLMITKLAEALKKIWSINKDNAPNKDILALKLALAYENMNTGIVRYEMVDPKIQERFNSINEMYDFLINNKPKLDYVVTHGDACCPNFIIDSNNEIGLIDLGFVGLCDKWEDISLALRSLQQNLNGVYGHLYKEYDPQMFLDDLGISYDEEKDFYFLVLDEFL